MDEMTLDSYPEIQTQAEGAEASSQALIEEDWHPSSKKEFCQRIAFGLEIQLFPGSPTCRPTLQILDSSSLMIT